MSAQTKQAAPFAVWRRLFYLLLPTVRSFERRAVASNQGAEITGFTRAGFPGRKVVPRMCLPADNHSARGLASTYQDGSAWSRRKPLIRDPQRPLAQQACTKVRQKGMKYAGMERKKR